METIGSRIKHIRKKKGLNQTDFAKIVGVEAKATVSGWENDSREPEVSKLKTIAEIGNVTLDWLIKGSSRSANDEPKASYLPGELRLRLEAKVPAGKGEIIDLTDWIQEEIFNFDYDNHVVLQIDDEFGDSMKPFMHPGDYIVISFSAKINDKDPVAARWDETKGAIKIVNYLKDVPEKVLLTSYNQNVSPIVVDRKNLAMYRIVSWIPNRIRR